MSRVTTAPAATNANSSIRASLRSDEATIEETLAAGAEKARAIARETLADVRDAMGVGPPRG